MIRKCNKLAQKEYKSMNDWVGKIIHWEFCKFVQIDKWYMHKEESVHENSNA